MNLKAKPVMILILKFRANFPTFPVGNTFHPFSEFYPVSNKPSSLKIVGLLSFLHVHSELFFYNKYYRGFFKSNPM